MLSVGNILFIWNFLRKTYENENKNPPKSNQVEISSNGVEFVIGKNNPVTSGNSKLKT